MVNQGGVEMRIAIIEDDEITRLELSKLLNTQGYETVLLTDFGNLTDELKQYSIELVLLDINLPYENGYEVCRKIKQVMPVPIIFVTSRDTNADELKSIQVGVGLTSSQSRMTRLFFLRRSSVHCSCQTRIISVSLSKKIVPLIYIYPF